jgi:broad specificity polyphosphatase/5'/3'-nucleotidase SurE
MNFRTRKTTFKDKINNIYQELENLNFKKNKELYTTNKIGPLSQNLKDRVKLFDQTINTPSKHNGYQRNIIRLIEETKRNKFNYKTFLNINIPQYNNLNKLNKSNKYRKSFISANTSFNFYKNKKKNDLLNNSNKRNSLKKEIMEELNNDKKRSSNISFNYIPISKSVSL